MKIENNTIDGSLRKMMRVNVSRACFNEYDFIRLFLAKLVEHGIGRIDSSKLGYELIEFYRDNQYEELFDMAVKQQIEGDFVDLSGCIQQAMLGGLLSFHGIQNSDERLILISNDEKKEIINSYEDKYVVKMEKLVSNYLYNHKFEKLYQACKNGPRIQLDRNGKTCLYEFDPEYIVSHFAENGFIENYCLSSEEKEKVKKLRLEKSKINR